MDVMIKKNLTIQNAILVLVAIIVLILPLTANADDADIVYWNGAIDVAPEILLSDNNGGAIVVHPVGGPYINPDYVSAQRYDYSGNKLWEVEVSHRVNPTYPDASYPAATEDMFGNIIVAYAAVNSVYAQRLDANGNKLWDEEIVVLYNVNPVHCPIITPDGAGGAYVGYGRKINHISNDGTVIDTNGYEYIPSSESVDEFSMVYDGQRIRDRPTGKWLPGGVFLAWYSTSTEKIHAQHFKGSLLWGDTTTKEGVIVSTAYTYIGNPVDNPDIHVIHDGIDGLNGGLIVAWSGRVAGVSQVRAQRINGAGDAVWGDDGVAVVDSSIVGGYYTQWYYYLTSPKLIADGAGGAILAWTDPRSTTADNLGDFNVYCQRINADGSFRWQINGIRVTRHPIDFANPESEGFPAMVSDGNDGIVIAVQYHDLSNNIFVNRIDGEGVTIWTEWEELSDDYFYNETKQDQNLPRIVFDGTGPDPIGAIVAWLGHDLNDTVWSEGFAKKIEISDTQPRNDNIADAQSLIPTYSSSGLGSVYRATNDGSSSCGTTGQPDVWYKFTAPEDGELSFNTCETHGLFDIDIGLDTVLSLHSAIPADIGNELACGDNSFRAGCAEFSFNTDSFVTRSLNSGETVYIRVARYDSSTNGQFWYNWSFEPIVDSCECNLNTDNSCNIIDYQIFIQEWGTNNCNDPGVYCACDLNADGSCNILDYQMFIQDWGRTNCP